MNFPTQVENTSYDNHKSNALKNIDAKIDTLNKRIRRTSLSLLEKEAISTFIKKYLNN